MTVRYSKQPSQRQLRISELIRAELAKLLLNSNLLIECGLEQAIISITEVRISPDLKHATAFVSSIIENDKPKINQSLPLLEVATRRLLAPKLGLRFMPQVDFVIDDSASYASKIALLLPK